VNDSERNYEVTNDLTLDPLIKPAQTILKQKRDLTYKFKIF